MFEFSVGLYYLIGINSENIKVNSLQELPSDSIEEIILQYKTALLIVDLPTVPANKM